MNRPTEITRNVPYIFSKEERGDLGGLLGEVRRKIKLKEDEKTATVKQFQSELAKLEEESTRLENALADNREFRDVECEIRYNSPKDGRKQVVRKDTNEIIDELAMSAEELQEELPLEEQSKAPVAGAAESSTALTLIQSDFEVLPNLPALSAHTATADEKKKESQKGDKKKKQDRKKRDKKSK